MERNNLFVARVARRVNPVTRNALHIQAQLIETPDTLASPVFLASPLLTRESGA